MGSECHKSLTSHSKRNTVASCPTEVHWRQTRTRCKSLTVFHDRLQGNQESSVSTHRAPRPSWFVCSSHLISITAVKALLFQFHFTDKKDEAGGCRAALRIMAGIGSGCLSSAPCGAQLPVWTRQGLPGTCCPQGLSCLPPPPRSAFASALSLKLSLDPAPECSLELETLASRCSAPPIQPPSSPAPSLTGSRCCAAR